MLGNTVTITVNAVAKAMNLVNQDAFSAEYRLLDTTEKYVLKISHRADKANKDGIVYARHVVDFTHTTYAVPGVSAEISQRFYVTMVAKDGESLLASYLVAGLSSWLTASTNANAIKVLNYES